MAVNGNGDELGVGCVSGRLHGVESEAVANAGHGNNGKPIVSFPFVSFLLCFFAAERCPGRCLFRLAFSQSFLLFFCISRDNAGGDKRRRVTTDGDVVV